jgi:hypothetical protein
MPTATDTPIRTLPRSTIYIPRDQAETLRALAADLGLLQPAGGGVRYGAGSLSALMRLIAVAAETKHRTTLVTFLRTLQQVTATDSTGQRAASTDL